LLLGLVDIWRFFSSSKSSFVDWQSILMLQNWVEYISKKFWGVSTAHGDELLLGGRSGVLLRGGAGSAWSFDLFRLGTVETRPFSSDVAVVCDGCEKVECSLEF
jgi:hypothetical protein